MKKKRQPKPIEPNQTYTVSQAADVLGVVPQTIRLWIKQGRLRHKDQIGEDGSKKVGWHRRFTGAQLLEAAEHGRL